MHRRDLLKTAAASAAVALTVGAGGIAIAATAPEAGQQVLVSTLPPMTLLQMAEHVLSETPKINYESPVSILATQSALKAATLRSASIESLARTDLMKALTFVHAPGGSYDYGDVLSEHKEPLKIAGGDLDVDLALIKNHGEAILHRERHMQLTTLALHLSDQAVNGCTARDPRMIDGLKTRAIRVVNQGGAGLSKTTLDKAISDVPGATHLLMSKKMRNRLSVAARADDPMAGRIVWDKDEYGNRQMKYAYRKADGTSILLPILVTDYDAGNNPVQAFDEAQDGEPARTSDQAFSSVFVLRLGLDGVHGVHNGIPEVDDLGEVQEKPVLRTRIEWLVNLAHHSEAGRSIVRITGVADQPMVA